MGPVAQGETTEENAVLGEKLLNHDQCNLQIQRLKDHLIAMDLEATEEARRHQQEVDELKEQIERLKADADNRRRFDEASFEELESVREENEHLKGLIMRMEERSKRDGQEIDNLKSCLDLSESSIINDV